MIFIDIDKHLHNVIESNDSLCMTAIRKYLRIMAEEDRLADFTFVTPNPEEMFNTALQIAEFAKAGTVLRSYCSAYNMTSDQEAYESDGAHTNLLSAIVDRALSHLYGPDFYRTNDNYSYREIMEAIRRHDLPENVTGDTPDNDSRDEGAKLHREHVYQNFFSTLSPTREYDFDVKVKQLLLEMEQKSTTTGRLLYVADKIAAIIMALCYDMRNEANDSALPFRHHDDPSASERDRQEMEMCKYRLQIINEDVHFASEMWSIDYFELRHLIDFDDSGWFTALVVMSTLQANGGWYSWREKHYSEKYFTEKDPSD